MGCELGGTGISQVTENILADRGRNYKLLWNRSRFFREGKDLAFFFVWCCVMAEQTQKNARFFLRCPDWFVCLASVLMEYVQF